MRSVWMMALLVTGLSGLSTEAQAQRRGPRRGIVPVGLAPELGVRLGYDFRVDEWSVGGQLRLPGPFFETVLSGDWYFYPGPNPWQLNADLVLRLGRFRALYAGGGVGIFHQIVANAGSTDVGPNVVVGVEPRRRLGSPVRAYAEGRWTFLNGATPFRLVFGLDFVLGH